MNQMLSKMQIH